MVHEMIPMIFLQMSLILAAPLQFPLLQPMQGTLQQQQLALQEQMLAIQQFQALHQFNAVPSPLAMNPQQPLLILLPNEQSNIEQDNRDNKLNKNIFKINKVSQDLDNDDSDSITIDAETEQTINRMDDKNSPMRAFLLVPNARFSIGGIISSIPFLPFEINVPDSISWIYDGISGIISGIGQSWPFNGPQLSENNKKSIWKNFNTRKIMPIVVMPLGQSIMPMQM